LSEDSQLLIPLQLRRYFSLARPPTTFSSSYRSFIAMKITPYLLNSLRAIFLSNHSISIYLFHLCLSRVGSSTPAAKAFHAGSIRAFDIYQLRVEEGRVGGGGRRRRRKNYEPRGNGKQSKASERERTTKIYQTGK
jgi:hypothetical protein